MITPSRVSALAAVLFTISTSSTAYAVKETGNGGDVVVCKSAAGRVTSIELYDFYEGRVRHGFLLDLGSSTLNYLEKLERIFKRLDRLNPNRSELFRSWLKDFFSEAEFLSGITLVDIPDTGNGYVPRGCTLEQIAVQREPYFPGDKRYTISDDLWRALPEDSKAGLILHELLFREARNQIFPHENSVRVRYLNSFLSTSKLETMSLKGWIETLFLAGFDHANAQRGVSITLTTNVNARPVRRLPKFYDDHTVKAAGRSNIPFTYSWNGVSIGGQYFTHSESSDTEFNTIGTLAWIWPRLDSQQFTFQQGESSVTVKIGTGAVDSFPLVRVEMTFHPDGSVKGLQADRKDLLNVEIRSPEYSGGCSAIGFYPSGIIRSCRVSGKGKLLYDSGQTLPQQDGTAFSFDEETRTAYGISTPPVRKQTFVGHCKDATVSLPTSEILDCQVVEGKILLFGQWYELPKKTSANLLFSSTGELQSYAAWDSDSNLPIATPYFKGACKVLFWNLNGGVECKSAGWPDRVLLQGKWVTPSGAGVAPNGSNIGFYPSGQPQWVVLEQNETFRTVTGNQQFPKGSVVRFGEDGLAQSSP
jgi:hypothetical protein